MVNNNEKEVREYIIRLIPVLERFLSDGTIPLEGIMKDFDIQFPNFETEHQLGIIRVSGNNKDEKKRTLKIGATEADSKHTVFIDLFSGTVDEIFEYLKSDDVADIWYDGLSKVSQQYCSVDWNGIIKSFKNNPEEKFERYKKNAETGDAEAAFHLGVCYIKGDGTPQNQEEAFRWTKISAEAGIVRAAYNLGVFYMFGQGTPKNPEKAFKWFKKSAEAGDTKAAYELGVCYAQGDGTPIDYEEAFKWYKMSAEAGNARAAYVLGNLYLYGYGTLINSEEAFKWYKISAEAGNAEAAEKVKNFSERY